MDQDRIIKGSKNGFFFLMNITPTTSENLLVINLVGIKPYTFKIYFKRKCIGSAFMFLRCIKVKEFLNILLCKLLTDMFPQFMFHMSGSGFWSNTSSQREWYARHDLNELRQILVCQISVDLVIHVMSEVPIP